MIAPRSLSYLLTELYPLECPQAEASTLGKMRTHVARWEDLTEGCPAEDIDRPKLLTFRKACLESGLQPSTINSHIRTVTGLARLAGVKPDTKRLKLIERDEPLPTPSLDDLTCVWRVTTAAEWPRNRKVNGRKVWCTIPPGLWWRAVLLTAFCTGLRRSDLFGLKWREIEADRIPTINRKTKKPQFIPIPAPLRPWLDLLARLGTDRVFGTSDRVQQIDRELNRMAHLVGMPSLGMQAMRRAAAEAYDSAHPGAGKLILNHGKTVTEISYVKVEKTLREASAKLVYPEAFLQGPTLEVQRKLF